MTVCGKMVTWALIGATGWCGLVLAVPEARAQAKAQPKKALSEDRTLVTKDGVPIRCTYFPSGAGKDSAVVVLLHGKRGNRLVWQTGVGNYPGYAQALQQNGFAVVTVDLRGHGESVPGSAGVPAANKKADEIKLTPPITQAMVRQDLEAVKRFLLEEHEKQQLNINKLAIVGADFSTHVALSYAVLDWSKLPYDDAPVEAQKTPRGKDVRALILLSPDATVPGLPAADGAALIRTLKMPTLIAVGNKDSQDRGAAKKLDELIRPKKDEEYVTYVEYDTKFRGTDLLNKDRKLEGDMYKFLDEYVKKANSEWRTRKSVLTD